MSIEPLAAPPRPSASVFQRTPISRALVPTTPALAGAFLLAAQLGLLPRRAGVAGAVALAASVCAVQLIRLALDIHSRQRTFGPCRGVGFLGLGVLLTGAGTFGALLLSGHPRSVPRSASLAAATLLGGTLLFLLGLLLLPGTAPTPLARIRRALDGAGIGICFLFSFWLLVVAPDPHARPLVVGVAVVASAGLAIALVTGLRAVRYRPAALACGAGVILGIIGMAAVTVLLSRPGPAGWLPLAALPLVISPSLISAGARHAATSPGADPPAGHDPGFAGYPILVIPVGVAFASAVYHLVNRQGFDPVSAGLGFGVVLALAVREAFAVVDIRRYARTVAKQEAHFRSLVSGSTDVTLVLDDDLAVRWQSPAAARHFGLSEQEVLGRPFAALVHPDDAPDVQEQLVATLTMGDDDRPALISARLRDGFGHWRDTESTLSDQRGVPAVGALVMHLRDVGERRELERTLHQMAFTDQLTGLANRREMLRSIAAMHSVPGQPGAVLAIELDGFTGVNDVRGLDIGDAVLIEVARRLRLGVDESDLPARLSGDEFAIVTPASPVQAYALASRILTMLGQAYELPGATVHLGANIGLAELSGATSAGDALGRAALALRRARQLRRGRIEWYDEALEAALLRRLTLEQELPGVVERGELDLVYQPVIDLVEGHPVGAESLLRWRHPRLGTVPAADFIPVAEDLGLIDDIGEWVLQHACRQLSSWLRDGRDLWLSINLAGRQLAAPNLVNTVCLVLENHQVPADRLLLEVTEQGVSTDVQLAVAQLAGLRALGARTALAQFGTGSTPLGQLRRLPIDVLKVDRVLYAEPVGRTGPATPIIDVVVGLGRRLGLEIIAEGLEAPAHLDVVRAAGCRYGQGFLFGRPAPAEHFEAFLESHRSPAG